MSTCALIWKIISKSDTFLDGTFDRGWDAYAIEGK